VRPPCPAKGVPEGDRQSCGAAIALSADARTAHDTPAANLAFAPRQAAGSKLAPRRLSPPKRAFAIQEATQLRPSRWRPYGGTSVRPMVRTWKIARTSSLERARGAASTGAAERSWLARAYLRAEKPNEDQAQIGHATGRWEPRKRGGEVRIHNREKDEKSSERDGPPHSFWVVDTASREGS